MKKKLLLIILSIILVVSCTGILVACKSGESAYEIAVRNGFKGTEQEWLESLKGADGINGTNGTNGTDGLTPTIGENGNWWLGTTDTGIQAAGTNGANGANGISPTIGENGNWWLGETDTGVKAKVEENLALTLGADGKWLFGAIDSGLTVEDTTYISYTQFQNELEGFLSLSLLNVPSAFDKVLYSVYRHGVATEEISSDDFIVKNAQLEGNATLLQITAPYFGKYNVKVDYFKDDEIVASVERDCVQVKASHYNFVHSGTTLPVLFAATEMVKLDHTYPTYVTINRNTTFDWNALPEKCYPMPNTVIGTGNTNLALFDSLGNQKTCTYGTWNDGSWGKIYASDDTVQTGLKYMKHWIAELYSMDSEATFTIYCDDLVSSVAYWWMYGNNIPAENFHINMYTDGSLSANWFKQYGYKSYAKFQTMKEQHEAFVASLKSGTDLDYTWRNAPHYIVRATDANVDYFVNTKSSIMSTIDMSEVGAAEYYALLDRNIHNYTIGEALQSVEDVGCTRDLEFLLRTRWIDNQNEEGNANDYFATNNGKKNLLILGTKPASEVNSNGCGANTTLMTFLPTIIDMYGEEYNIFYKGHPGAPISQFSDGRVEYFDANNIIVLPNAVPAETYMYLYDEVFICGYYSSTMSSSMVGQTLFFFGTEARISAQTATAAMFDPNSSNYMGVFENTKFLTYDAENSQVIVKGIGE